MQAQLFFTRRGEKSQVNAQAMQRVPAIGQVHRTIQEPALFHPVGGGIDLFGMNNGKPGQDGIPVMAVRIQGVLAIGMVGPDGIGQLFVLCLIRPVMVAGRLAGILTDHLLQENHIGMG